MSFHLMKEHDTRQHNICSKLKKKPSTGSYKLTPLYITQKLKNNNPIYLIYNIKYISKGLLQFTIIQIISIMR